jgi:SAM-dependent methyltransferase
MSVFSGSESLNRYDWEKAYWGNNLAAVSFLDATGLLSAPRRILDIGCGKGYLLRHLADGGHVVTGIDQNPDAIAECGSGLDVRQASATELPFPDGSFEIVLSFDVFEHIQDSDRHLNEVRRVLGGRGHYLIGTPNKWTNIPFETLRHFRKAGIHHAFDFLQPGEHCALHSYRQLRRRLEKHGFSVKFYDVPVVNDFFREKIERFAGPLGLMALKVINPDRLPLPLRTNFFVAAELAD